MRCIFDRTKERCPIMVVSQKEKKTYCIGCKARCDEEYQAIERFYDMLCYQRSADHSYDKIAKLHNQFRKILGRSVTIMYVKKIDKKNPKKSLEHILFKKGWTLKDFADKCDLSYGTVINIMSHKKPCSLKSAITICETLGLDHTEYFEKA